MSENTILCSSSGNNAGYISRYPSKVWASDCFAVIPKHINDDYMYFTLLALHNSISELQNGSAQPHVYAKDLEKMKIPVPKNPEKIQHWVDKISQPYNEKNEKQTRIQELEKTIQERIKSICDNEDCEEVELGSVCEICCGKNLPKTKAVSGLYNVYGGGNTSYTHNEYNFEGPNIIISRVGNNGITLVNEKFYLTDNGFVLNINNNKKYIMYYLCINKTLVVGNGSAQKVISKTALSKIKIKLPKNKKLIDDLNPIFQEIEEHQQAVKNADELYKQYIHELSNEAIPKP